MDSTRVVVLRRQSDSTWSNAEPITTAQHEAKTQSLNKERPGEAQPVLLTHVERPSRVASDQHAD